MPQESRELNFELTDGIGTITLNRPEKYNALTTPLCERLRDVLEDANRRDDVKVLVITGAGKAFCAGSDIETRLLARIVDGRYVPLEKQRHEIMNPVMLYLASAFQNLSKPIIASVNGIAAGFGLSFALLCDFRIASDKARFAASWINVGLTPDIGATFLLPRIVGVDKALKIFVTGKPVDAVEAERIGLVTQAVPHDCLQDATMELARTVACGPSVAIEWTKRAVYHGLVSEMKSQLHFENYAQNVCFLTRDFREGVQAFIEKRRPLFEGR